jgi:glycerol-3-phosphate dehydrogenase (NAD(P)+)
MAIVTIVGAGLMGSAVAYPLADNGHSVRLVGTHLDGEIIQSCKENGYHPRLKRDLPAGVRPFFIEELTGALEGAEIIVSGVNSLGVHWIGETLAPHVHPGHTIIAITKGLEVDAQGELVILPDVVRGLLPAGVREQVNYAAVGGPCIAGELAGKRHSLVIFGSREAETAEKLASSFRTPYYHVWTTTDLVGLEMCAALKNAYTLGVGLATGLLEKSGGVDPSGAHMYNLSAGLFATATHEIERMLAVAGVERSFAYGLPGAGDLYVTCVGGRTIRFGTLLGKGIPFGEARQIMAGETLESIEIIRVMAAAIPQLERRGLLGKDELPFMRALIEIVVHGTPVDLPLETFFGRG